MPVTQLEPAQHPPVVVNGVSLRSHIEERVTNAILEGVFHPGDRLVETIIADRLGVSRAPVREVLSALEKEGLITNVPRRGYYVIDFTDKDIDEIYSLRLWLEVEAFRRAIARCGEADVATMQGLLEQLGQPTSQAEAVELDLAFHERIMRMADHSRLYAAWNGMRRQARLLIGMTSRTHPNHPEQRHYHEAILQALTARDERAAEASLTEHILDARRRAYGALRAVRSAMPEATLGQFLG